MGPRRRGVLQKGPQTEGPQIRRDEQNQRTRAPQGRYAMKLTSPDLERLNGKHICKPLISLTAIPCRMHRISFDLRS